MTSNASCHSLTQPDQDAIEKAAQSADFLVQNLQAVNRSANPLLSDFALELIPLAVSINARLHRIMINIK